MPAPAPSAPPAPTPAPHPEPHPDDAMFLPPTLVAASKWLSARTAAGRPAPTLVLDLDDTVLYRTRGLLDALLIYGLPASVSSSLVGAPYPGALEAVHDLAGHYRVVAITARWSRGAAYTSAWLSGHGLGDMPVIVASRPHPGDESRVAFKAAAVRWLQRAGLAPLVGVGDRPSDMAAYLQAGLHACVVAHMPPPPDGAAAPPPDPAGEAACWEVLRKARQREEAAAAAAAPAGAARVPSVTYFTDCAGVHAAAAAAAAAPAVAGEGGGGGGAAPGATGLPPPAPLVDVGQGLPPLALFRPPALAAPPPPIWHQAHLTGHLKALAAAHAAAQGDAPQGGADWEDEASATWFVRGAPPREQQR